MLAVDETHERLRGARRARRRVERQRNAVVEANIGERVSDRVIVVADEPPAVGADRAGEDEMQSVGAAVEVLQSQAVGGVSVGDVDARENRPAAGVFAQDREGRTSGAGVDGLKGKPVIALGDERFEGRAFERPLNKGAPLRVGGLRKDPRQRRLLSRHFRCRPPLFRAAFSHEALRRATANPPRARRALFSRPNALTSADCARGRERGAGAEEPEAGGSGHAPGIKASDRRRRVNASRASAGCRRRRRA